MGKIVDEEHKTTFLSIHIFDLNTNNMICIAVNFRPKLLVIAKKRDPLHWQQSLELNASIESLGRRRLNTLAFAFAACRCVLNCQGVLFTTKGAAGSKAL